MKLTSGDKTYLKLMGLIEKKEEYDEQYLKQKLKLKPSKFALTKYYLHKNSLRHLGTFNIDNSIYTEIQLKLNNIRTLVDKHFNI